MKLFGYEIKRVAKPKHKAKAECAHRNTRCVDLSSNIHHCNDCGQGCHYIDGKLTAITFDNMHMSDSGTYKDGIYQF